MDPRYYLAKQKLAKIKRKLLVCSGKGGVGKSIVAASLALAYADMGKKVGLLDLDLHGPSIPRIFSVKKTELKGGRAGMYPIERKGVKIASLGLITPDKPIPVKGRVKEGLVLDLLGEIEWGELDYLIIDAPPGTGDELTVTLRVLGTEGKAVIVTTPSILSLDVVKRLIALLKDEKVPIIGVIENLAYIVCGKMLIEPFGPSKASQLGVRLLARLPIDPNLEQYIVEGGELKKAAAFWGGILRAAKAVEELWSK
ncbi:MAG TPA: ATP-binding protein [Thermofilum sp.]|nr:ATP-binding protein [Thermofilum sp.]